MVCTFDISIRRATPCSVLNNSSLIAVSLWPRINRINLSEKWLPARLRTPRACLARGLGEPRRAEVQKLYHSRDLTVLNVIWGSRMTIMPHNHEMRAVDRRCIPKARIISSGVGFRGARTASSKQPAQGHYVRGMRSPSDTISFSFRNQSDFPFDARNPRLWRRLFCVCAYSERVGPRDPCRATLHCREEYAL